jgi:hypothetical protein
MYRSPTLAISLALPCTVDLDFSGRVARLVVVLLLKNYLFCVMLREALKDILASCIFGAKSGK